MDREGLQLRTLSDGVDAVRSLPTTALGSMLDDHPLARRERMALDPARSKQGKLAVLADVYGAHMPLRLMMEDAIVGQLGRPPAMDLAGDCSHGPASLGREILDARADDLEIEDVLGRPDMCPEVPASMGQGTAQGRIAVDVHYQMERALNMVPPKPM